MSCCKLVINVAHLHFKKESVFLTAKREKFIEEIYVTESWKLNATRGWQEGRQVVTGVAKRLLMERPMEDAAVLG